MKKYILSFCIFFALFHINQSFAESPSYINKLIEKTNSVYYELNSNLEFLDEKGVKSRLQTYSCYTLNSSNYYNFSSKGYILKISDGKYCFAKTINKESKIYYKNRNYYFKIFDFDNPILLENNSYYAYKFSKYYFFEDTEGFYLSDFTKLGYTKENIIILKKDSRYYIVKDFKKTKLFDSNLIDSVKDKNYFASLIYDDLKKTNISESQIKTSLEKIKEVSAGFKTTDKTKEAYNWVLSNISYFSGDLNKLENSSIFSGLYTFQNKVGVCDGYTKLFVYLLMFSGIENVEVKTGFVINSDLFPEYGHAWVKVGSYYYDPTFDDPIGQKTTKIFSQYKYFKLPKDIIYADRLDGTNLSSTLKKSSKETRNLIVEKRFYDTAKKFLYSDYVVLKKYIFKINNNLKFNEKISVEKAKNLFTYMEVNNDYSYADKSGNKKYIKNILYYSVIDTSLENTFARIFNYNKTGVYLIKWNLGNGKYEYRLSNNIKF